MPNSREQPLIEVVIDAEATKEEADGVSETFARFGVDARVDAGFERRSLGELPWIPIIQMPLSVFLYHFLKSAGEESGKKAGQLLARFFQEIWSARSRAGREEGTIWLQDTDTGSELIVTAPPGEEDCEVVLKASNSADPIRLKYDKDSKQWVELP